MNPNSCVKGSAGKKIKYCDIASVMVEDNGTLQTINFCKVCQNLRERSRKEPAFSNEKPNTPVAEKRSRGKLSTGVGARGVESKIMVIFVAHPKGLRDELLRH